MGGPILVINAGSSSVKFSVFEEFADGSLCCGIYGQAEKIGTAPRLKIIDAAGHVLMDDAVEAPTQEAAIQAIHTWFAGHTRGEENFGAVGHRVVHGGLTYTGPVLIDDKVMTD